MKVALATRLLAAAAMLAPVGPGIAASAQAASPGLFVRAATAAGASPALSAAATHFTAGFQIDKPARVRSAAAVGITSDIEYDGPPRSSSRLGKALTAAHMNVIDARISAELYYWECHRTHTVAPPPPEEENWYCKTDEDPSVDSPAVVLQAVREYVRQDAANPMVSGYWVLDDWPQWDGGSARTLLQEIHAAIDEVTPNLPAICGFGGAILAIGQPGGFDLATAENYSNEGCDMVGLYDYAEPTRRASDGDELEWTMKILLAEEAEDLAGMGWVESDTPMLGIGQAWSGRYGHHEFEPGLSDEQILAQARAFCADGATAIAWYGWDDSGFHKKTQTPNNSAVIQDGIRQGISACAEMGAG